MPGYRVIALDPETARKVRDTRRSPGYGHPVHSEIATGYGPCRLCLRDFEIGVDRRLLFTYDPFFRIEPFPLPGPVFIHEAGCARYPEDGGFPADVLAHRVTLAAYDRGPVLRAEERVAGAAIPDAVSRLISRADVAYLHVRDTAAGCYDFRIERAA
jgi:hypothetical protein